ncbi:MAG TPA: cytochrome c3 family protein, partial [Gemmataceae bacterium]|nr:cytochrome c3 family protein [Gemmataceae bacterium]
MPQIFHRSFNVISKVSIFGFVFILIAFGWVMIVLARSSFNTNVGVAHVQPVPFSHEHHVRQLGIDCRYCHTSVEESSFAGIPPTKTCMNCHSQIWVGSPILEPVHKSYRENE